MTWSVRGIDDEVREAALAAARRSGKPVGEWLNGLIRQTASGQASPAPASAVSSGGPEPDEVERLERGLLALATRLDRLRGPATPPLDSRTRGRADLGPIADAINDEIGRLGGERPRAPSRPERGRADADVQFVAEPATGGDDRLGGVLQALNALDRRLQALATPARTVAAPPPATYEPSQPATPPATAAANRAARDALDARAAGAAPAAPAAPSSLGDLERAVAAISRRQQSLDPTRPPGPDRRPAARPLLASDMERHFKELSGRLDKLAVEPTSARARDDRLGGELRDLRGLVEQGFATRIAPLAETVSDLRLGLDRVEQEIVRSRRDDRLGAVVDGIAALRDDLAAGMRVEVPPVLAQFERAHADILDRLDGLRAERADSHGVTELRHEIADLRAALETRDAAAGIGALESRLVALGRRIDQLVAGRGESFAALDEIRAVLAQQRPAPDLGRVEARLEAIDQRMSILRGIEDRIVQLADRLDLMEQSGGRAPAALGVIADEIAALTTRLDQLPKAAAPASEAVLATVADRLEDLGAGIERLERRAGISAGSADVPALGDLADRIEAAAARLDRAPALTAQTVADPALIAAIDDKFAQIARQLDTAEDRFATLGAIEDALVEMHGLLSHRGPSGAVEEAARAAVAEFVRLTETAGSDKALDSVVAELNTLKTQTQGLEARTADGLKAVQEALTSVAGLLQQNRTLDGVGRAARNSREDARPLEPGSGKPEPMAAALPPTAPIVTTAPVAPPIAEPERDAVTEPVADTAGSSRRADFIAAARRAAQAAQAARIAEPQPDLDGAADDEPRRGTLARIGAALRGRATPVATIAAVLLLAGIATEISLNGLERLRRGLEPVSSRIAAVAPAPTHAPIAVPTPAPAPEAPQVARAPVPAPETLGAPVQPGTFGTTPAPTTGFVADPVETGAIAARPATPPAANPAPTAATPDARPSYPVPEEKIGPQALRQAAANGDPRAAFEVGQRYAEGRGVAQNWVAALEWFRRAAEADFAPAQYRLASGLEKGVAGSRDIAEAKRWYQAAAEHGNVRAMHNLGVLYANERDINTALPWFQKAGDLGLKDSQFNLGIIHALGSGVKQDLAVSYKWFSLAAAQGDQEATKKRDDIAQYLDKTALASAKLAVDTWKARPIERAANDETSAWSETATARGAADPIAERIARVQTLLKAQGAYAGPVDGQASADTKAAVKAFQRKAGLKPTGDVDDAVVRALASGKAA